MKTKLLQGLLAATIFSFTTVANAGLINTSENSFIDSETSIEWMDFGITNNLTYEDVLGKLSTGEQFQGWRLATEDEIVSL